MEAKVFAGFILSAVFFALLTIVTTSFNASKTESGALETHGIAANSCALSNNPFGCRR